MGDKGSSGIKVRTQVETSEWIFYQVYQGEEETVTVITTRYFSVRGSFLPDLSTCVRLLSK